MSSDRTATALVAALLLFLPLVFSTHTHEPFAAPKIFVMAVIAAALWIAHARSGRTLLVSGTLATLAVLFVLAALIATAGSIDLASSLYGRPDSHVSLVHHLCFATFVLAGARAHRAVRWSTIAAAGSAAAYALVQDAGLDPIAWTNVAYYCDRLRPFATLGHANALGGYLAMAAPLVLVEALAAARVRRFARATFFFALLAAFIRVIVLGASRGALLALLMALSIVLLSVARGTALPKRTLVVVLALALLGTSPILVPRLATFFQSPSRLAIFAAAWRTFLSAPFFGAGLDTFQLAFQTQRTLDYWQLEWGATPQHAHNELLQILATEGALGGILALGAIGVAARLVTQSVHTERAAWGAVVAAAAVHALFSFHTVASASLAAIALGQLGAAEVTYVWSRARRWSVAVIAVIAALALGLAPLLASAALRRGDGRAATAWLPWSDATWSRFAQTALAEGRDRDALVGFGEARRLSPLNAYHHANLGRFFARSMPGLSPAERRTHALPAYDAALLLDPNNVILRVDAAVSALAMDDKEAAFFHLERTVADDPTFAQAWAALAHAHALEGHFVETRVFLMNAVTNNWHGDEQGVLRAEAALVRLMGGRGVDTALAEAWDARVALERPACVP
ncbi:MAG: O-antigen ligase family protein [Deltaproteobacteria bacterium]|nr:O-antigen ligase family protein [Deltaproteobacteria bacterium]